MKPAFEITQGERLPTLTVQAFNAVGIIQDISAATAVVAYIRHIASGIEISPPAEISNAELGEVTISWAAGDTAMAGLYQVRIVLTFPVTGPWTMPTCPTSARDELVIEVCPV